MFCSLLDFVVMLGMQGVCLTWWVLCSLMVVGFGLILVVVWWLGLVRIAV